LFEQIAERYGHALTGVPAVGDAVRDLIAASAVGCELHLVLTGKSASYRGRALPDTLPANTQAHADLSAFVDFLLERETAAP
jgi:D-glycero-D-manno-heptose 1,7-bisphosphate phosphatase